MFYFVSTSEDKITSKNEATHIFGLPDGYQEITKAQYDSIGSIPCSFISVDGEITGIEHIEPTQTIAKQLPTSDERILSLEETTNFLLGLEMI